MRKIFVIAARDYQAAVRTKSFIISLLVMPLMMFGSILVQGILKDRVDTTEKRFAVVDRSPEQKFGKELESAAAKRDVQNKEKTRQTKPVFAIELVPPSENSQDAINEQRFELSERVRNRDLFGFLEIGPEVTAYGKIDPEVQKLAEDGLGEVISQGIEPRFAVRYQSNSPTYDDFRKWAKGILTEAVQEQRFTAVGGADREKLKAMLQPVPMQPKGLSKRDPLTGEIEEAKDEGQLASILVPGGLMLMMFMLIMVGATPLMQGVVEEKMQRIAEVLLGSVRPFELMFGKLVGMVGVSATLAAVYLSGALWAAHQAGYGHFIPTEMLAWFIVYQTLAVLMFGSLFIAIGAACTDMRETQTMLWPVMLLITTPLFVWINVIREPNSMFSTCISLFPFATPTLMMGRQAVPPGIPIWQPIVGVVLVLATTLVCVYIAGRIFRVGILMQGKGAKVSDMVKWVIRG